MCAFWGQITYTKNGKISNLERSRAKKMIILLDARLNHTTLFTGSYVGKSNEQRQD